MDDPQSVDRLLSGVDEDPSFGKRDFVRAVGAASRGAELLEFSAVDPDRDGQVELYVRALDRLTFGCQHDASHARGRNDLGLACKQPDRESVDHPLHG